MAATQVLIVEDEAVIARGIQTELEHLGYQVPAIASSGNEALQKAAQTNPDLVLMDIVLKGDMDGIETTKQLRRRHDIPVVYLTAYADDQTLQRAQRTKPFGYLLKPYQERELHTTIQLALFKHKSEQLTNEDHEWLADTLRCIGDAVIVTNADVSVRLLNAAAESLTGWSQQDALGTALPDVLVLGKHETNHLVRNAAIQALESGHPVPLGDRSVLMTKQGREVPIEGDVAPLYDDREHFKGLVLAFRERPALKQAPRYCLNLG